MKPFGRTLQKAARRLLLFLIIQILVFFLVPLQPGGFAPARTAAPAAAVVDAE